MKYYSISRSTVKITLSKEDMREYSLCAENIESRTEASKKGLARLLSEMKLFSDYTPDRLFLEAFPKNEGGCVLYVSKLSDGEQTVPPDNRVILKLKSLDCLIAVSRGVMRLSPDLKTCAYRQGDEYILEARGCDRRTAGLFLEYGEICDGGCFLEEYAVPLCTENACRIFAEL